MFRVRRAAIAAWLEYLREVHPDYRNITIDHTRLVEGGPIPEDGNVRGRVCPLFF